MKYVIANFKANKNLKEGLLWLKEFEALILRERLSLNVKVVICPPLYLLAEFKKTLSKYKQNVYLGAQDISRFPRGAYTGEVAADLIKDMADFALIGHSERRKYFRERDEILFEKTRLCLEALIEAVFCVRGKSDEIPNGVNFAAYEPVDAIGSGKAQDVLAVRAMIKVIKRGRKYKVFYGGSVTGVNAVEFLRSPEIDGILIGGASLDANIFYRICQSLP